MRDRLIKNYKAAAATLRDATQLAKDLADAVRNDFSQEWSQATRIGHIDHSPLNNTLYVDPRGTVRRATEMPKRLTLRKRVIDYYNLQNHRAEEIAAVFEAAKIIRQRKAAVKQSRRQRNAQSRRDRINRMAQNFASRYDRA